MNKNTATSYIIQTVNNALNLLEQFEDGSEELGVTELSRRLKLDKNNVFRLLATLESHHFVEQNNATRNYRLGLKNLELGQIIIRQRGMLRQARPILERLTAEGGETSYLGVLKGSHLIYLEMVESPLPVRVVPRIGMQLPAHCTAAGKALLACSGDNRLAGELRRMELNRLTPKTVTDPAPLRRELQQIARQGYAVEDEEFELSVRGIAAPVYDHQHNLAGVLGITGPVLRMTQERLARELIPLVMHGADELSARLGCFAPRPGMEALPKAS